MPPLLTTLNFHPLLPQTSFPSEDENKGCMTSQQQGTSPHKTGTTTLAGGFADSFQRASSAVLEAEEAAAQHRQQEAAGGSPDSGHVSFRSGRAAGGSRHSSPGSVAGSDGGSQPSSPLVRIRQAVSGLTSRLMPSSLPQLLPSGAVDVAGQELSPMSNGAGTFFRLASPARLTSRPDQPAAAVSAPHLRRISTAGRSGGAASPTAGMGDSAGSGAVLGRRGPGLTPFNEADALLAGSPQQEQQSDSGPAQAAPAFRTPQRAVAPAGLPPHGYASGAPPAAQSQPATPSELLRPPQPPPSHRRAFTFSYPTTEGGHSRRRRRLTIDLLRMANLKPDLHQPALAAAFAIAANPSPRAAGALGRVPAGGSLRGSLGGSRRLGVSPLMQGGAWSADGDGANGIDGTEHLALPVRTLRFDDSDAAVDEDGAEVDGTHGNGELQHSCDLVAEEEVHGRLPRIFTVGRGARLQHNRSSSLPALSGTLTQVSLPLCAARSRRRLLPGAPTLRGVLRLRATSFRCRSQRCGAARMTVRAAVDQLWASPLPTQLRTALWVARLAPQPQQSPV